MHQLKILYSTTNRTPTSVQIFFKTLYFLNLPCTGMDRIVRMWNPYVAGKSTGMLRGHNAPIFYLFIAEDENRIFSLSTDKCIKVRSYGVKALQIF